MEQFSSVALLVPELKELLEKKDYLTLKEILKECANPLDFADAWRNFSEDERLQLFRLIQTSKAMKLFEALELEDQRFLLQKLSDTTDAGSLENNVGPMLENMDSPDVAKIFNKMPARSVSKMKSLIKKQQALAHIDYLMKFPEGTAGSLMHPEFVRVTPKMSANQALNLLQAIVRPNQKEHLYSVFVTDEQGKALGWLSLQELVSAPEDERLGELMNSVEGIKLRPDTDQEEVSKLFSKYQLNAAPVVDEAGRLLGVVTLKDIISIVKQEATEDIAKMAGTRAKDIREERALKIVFFRMPWLVVTLGGGLLISLIIRHFEPVLAKAVALASFSPLIAGMGGNVGSQSATVMVRSLALGHLESRAAQVKAVFRELRVGLMLGAVYGIALAGFAYLVYGHQYGVNFGVVVAIGMGTSMTVAATMGAIEPLLFHRLGVDPATATGPLITTITDIVSNFTYFTLATVLILHGK